MIRFFPPPLSVCENSFSFLLRTLHPFGCLVPGRLSASSSSPDLPVPELSIYSRSGDTAVLVCRAPRGQRPVLFVLHRRYDNKVGVSARVSPPPPPHSDADFRCCLSSCLGSSSPPSSQTDSQELRADGDQAFVSVSVLPAGSAQLFCCLYKNKDGRYSAYSPFLQLERQKGASEGFTGHE